MDRSQEENLNEISYPEPNDSGEHAITEFNQGVHTEWQLNMKEDLVRIDELKLEDICPHLDRPYS